MCTACPSIRYYSVWFSEIFFKVNFDLGNKGQGQMLSQPGTTLLLGSFITIHKKIVCYVKILLIFTFSVTLTQFSPKSADIVIHRHTKFEHNILKTWRWTANKQTNRQTNRTDHIKKQDHNGRGWSLHLCFSLQGTNLKKGEQILFFFLPQTLWSRLDHKLKF